MQLEAKKLLSDVLGACEAIQEHTRGKTFQAYEESRLVRAATEREFSIIGEALSRLERQAPDVARQAASLP